MTFRLLLLNAVSVLLYAEHTWNDLTLNFVGDSMVANWDVENSFPNRVTKNIGRDRAFVSGRFVPFGW